MGDPVSVVLAIVYAVATIGTGLEVSGLGQRLGAERPVPLAARGLLVPGRGVVQLAEGTRVRTGHEAGAFELDGGQLRLIADGPLSVVVRDMTVRVGGASEAVVSRADGQLSVCAVRGAVTVEGASEPDAAQSNTGAHQITVGMCWQSPGGQLEPIEPTRAFVFQRAIEGSPIPQPAIPDVVGDLEDQVAEVEAEHSETLDQGPRQEAQSCGCSENGGSGGGLDPTGSTQPNPEPERPEPGLVRIRIEIPRR